MTDRFWKRMPWAPIAAIVGAVCIAPLPIAAGVWMLPAPSIQVSNFVEALRHIRPFADITRDGSCWRQLPFEHGYPPRIRCRYSAAGISVLMGSHTGSGNVMFAVFSQRLTDDQETELPGWLDFAALHRLLCPDAAAGRAEAATASLLVQAGNTPWRRHSGEKQVTSDRSVPGAWRRIAIEETGTCRLRLEKAHEGKAFRLALNYRAKRPNN